MQFDLVFEGGGAKGMVFVGAMEILEQAGHTSDRLLGTSAGAITAALLAAEYSSEEMLAALNEREGDRPVFEGFMGRPGPFEGAIVEGSVTFDFFKKLKIPFLPSGVSRRLGRWMVGALMKVDLYSHLFSFVELGGWYSADRFVSWLTQKLNQGSFRGAARAFGAMTLKGFFEATGRELTVIAADTTDQRLLALNHRTAPDCPVVWAVRMSMSIPFIWQEVMWDATWGTYRGRDVTGHAIVDGGVLSNFPIELLVADSTAVEELVGAKRSDGVIGLLIDESAAVPGVAASAAPAAKGIGRLKTIERGMRLVDTMRTARDKDMIEELSDLIVRLPARGYGTTEFGMSDEKREKLVEAGRVAMREHLTERTPEPTRRGARRRGVAPGASRANELAERTMGGM